MKKYIKNITDDPKNKYEPATMAFNELGKRTVLKPGEKAETKLNGENIDGKRLRFFSEKDLKVDKNDN